MDFQKVIYENVEKNPFISRQIYRSETFLSFMKFYFVHIVHYVRILKNSYYAYIPPYMHKSLLTLGDKKEQQQIEFMKNCQDDFLTGDWKSQNALFHLPD